MEYNIFVTKDSNLYCEYCSVLVDSTQRRIAASPAYKLDTLIQYIEKTQSRIDERNVDIIFLVGETTLDFKYIMMFMNYQKENSSALDFHYMLHTNGLLLAKIPLFILSNLESILLSINYSKIPHTNYDEGFFKQIINSVYKVKRTKNIPIIGKFIISEKHNLYNEIMLFHPFFDSISWQIERNEAFIDFDIFYLSYNNNLTQLMELWTKYLQEGTVLKFIPFISNVCFLNNKPYPINFCCGNQKQVVYTQTEGRCFNCSGNAPTKPDYDYDISDKLPFHDAECYNCHYIKICQGCCGKMYSGYVSSHIKEYCMLNKIQFDFFEKNIDIINNASKRHHLNLSLSHSIYHCSNDIY